MVDLTRRKTVLGMGLLAAGSGAAFSNAAFADSVAADADLRVVVEQNLTFGAGDGFDPGEDNFTDNPDLFDEEDINEGDGGAFDGDVTPPLAYVDGENENLDVRVAVPLGSSERFEELFQITNNLDDPVDIGIAYDRDASPNQYGEDISVGGGGDLNPDVAQQAYQFQVSGSPGTGTVISPEPGAPGVGTDDASELIETATDRPANAIAVAPGESINIDLAVDTATDSEDIKDAADVDLDTFGFQRDTVQLINGFTVGTMTDGFDA